MAAARAGAGPGTRGRRCLLMIKASRISLLVCSATQAVSAFYRLLNPRLAEAAGVQVEDCAAAPRLCTVDIVRASAPQLCQPKQAAYHPCNPLAIGCACAPASIFRAALHVHNPDPYQRPKRASGSRPDREASEPRDCEARGEQESRPAAPASSRCVIGLKFREFSLVQF